MKNFSLLVLVASISFIAGAGLTYVAKTPWTSDMTNQPSIKPQEWPLLPPEGSVATDLVGGATGPSSGSTSKSVAGHQDMGHQHGASAAPGHHSDSPGEKHDHGPKGNSPGTSQQRGPSSTSGHQHDGAATKHDHGSKKAPEAPAKAPQHNHSSHPHVGGGDHDHGTARGSAAIEPHGHGAGAGDGQAHGGMPGQVVNPIKASEISVKEGHQLFNIYCSVCHGTEGRGGMPMASKLSGIPKFTAELLRGVDDNHMFSMVTSGHGPMPGYAEALTPEERWHVTNYIRTLQKILAEEKRVAVRQGASR